MVALVRRHRPVHLSIVGGEPLVRYRELCEILPLLDRMGVEVQLVTSAVRPIPEEWNSIACLHLVVSIDGLAPEHDRRRAPATYDRILQNIAGQLVTVHCTVTRPMLERSGYLAAFCRFWSDRPEVRQIWFSIYTPQEGDYSAERLTLKDREVLFGELAAVAGIPESASAEDGARRLSRSAALAPGVHLRAADYLNFGRPENSHRTVPVGGQAGLFGMRLSRVDWHARVGRAETRRPHSAVGDFERIHASGQLRRSVYRSVIR